MKNLTLILAFCFTTNLLAKTDTEFIDRYRPKSGAFKILRVPMSYDSDSVQRPKPRGLKMDQIYRVDYVATSPKNGITDYQRYLNRQRWKTLRSFLNLEENKTFEKHIFYQTNKSEAKELFHGFMVYYRPSAEKMHELSFKPMEQLVDKLARKQITDNTKEIDIAEAEWVDTIHVGNMTKIKKSELEYRLMRNNQIIEWGYDSLGRDKKYHNAFYILSKVSPGLFAAFAALKDRSIFDMLSRKKITDKTLMVTDMTGSMYPYYSQILVWHALKIAQGKKVQHVFFNDGDAKTTVEKEIGNSGGLYTVRTNKFLPVYREMQKCMKGGGGGDCPENNFEAVLHGLEKHKETENIIMICDNWATPRDGELLNQISKPIEFIMCGTKLGLNKDYLHLVLENGGTITTIEQSLEDLNCMKNGDHLCINEDKFMLKKNKFVKL